MVHSRCLVLFHLILPLMQPENTALDKEKTGDFAMPGTALLASPYTKHLPILNSARLPILSTHQAEKAFVWVVGGPRTLG